MKHIVTSILIGLFSLSSYSQCDSLKADKPEFQTIIQEVNAHGIYGGLQTNYSKFGSRSAILLGGEIAWLVNHTLAIGGVGYSFVNEPEPNTALGKDAQYQINGGYGGVLIKYIIAPRAPLHITTPLKVGAGGVAYTQTYTDNWDNNGKELSNLDEATFFVIEPGIELEMNLLKFVRLSFGISYRITSDIILETETGIKRANARTKLVEPDFLNNWSYGVVFQVGIF